MERRKQARSGLRPATAQVTATPPNLLWPDDNAHYQVKNCGAPYSSSFSVPWTGHSDNHHHVDGDHGGHADPSESHPEDTNEDGSGCFSTAPGLGPEECPVSCADVTPVCNPPAPPTPGPSRQARSPPPRSPPEG